MWIYSVNIGSPSLCLSFTPSFFLTLFPFLSCFLSFHPVFSFPYSSLILPFLILFPFLPFFSLSFLLFFSFLSFCLFVIKGIIGIPRIRDEWRYGTYNSCSKGMKVLGTEDKYLRSSWAQQSSTRTNLLCNQYLGGSWGSTLNNCFGVVSCQGLCMETFLWGAAAFFAGKLVFIKMRKAEGKEWCLLEFTEKTNGRWSSKKWVWGAQ